MRLPRRRRPHKVTIVYRSGATVTFRCEEITVGTTGNEITRLKWDDAKPRPLHAGLADIAAVWIETPL